MILDLSLEVERVDRMLDACSVPRPPAIQAVRWTPRDASLAARIDHTLLRPDATRADVVRVCEEAVVHRFAAVCVAPVFVSTCVPILAGTVVRLATVCGFPHGNQATETKTLEAKLAVADGAEEIDMVLHLGALRDGDFLAACRDVAEVVKAAGSDRIVKVILETALLRGEEKVVACRIAERAGAHFVKTSTGFASGGATVEDVRLLRAVVGDRLGVKASGGIRTRDAAEAMLAAGADRIGCSASVEIVRP